MMISKEKFVKLIEDNCKFFDQVISLAENQIELWDTDMVTAFNDVFTSYIKESFNQDGLEWIEWYCYSKRRNPDLKAHDKDNNEICATPEDLYDFLTTNKDGDLLKIQSN